MSKIENRKLIFARTPELSVVVPVYNEEPNIAPLCKALRDALDPAGRPFEVLLVDDGSTDASAGRIAEECRADDRFRLVSMPANAGQARALSEGFAVSRGRIVASLDADLQNDPADIPALVAELQKGFDAVCGWRRFRKDPWLGKIVPSRIFNGLLHFLFGAPVHDVSCTLRVYRGEVAHSLYLEFADLSFIPVLLHLRGLRVAELEIRHHPRTAGEAKYVSPTRFGYTLKRLWRLWWDNM